jgi:hypothetical protein
VIILDENIPEDQRVSLNGWRIAVQQIGFNNGRKGMKDDEIIPFLHQLRRPTFFTRDWGFYDRTLCHARYSLVFLAVEKQESAVFIRRLLHQPNFRTQTQRMGTVIRVSQRGLSWWGLHAIKEIRQGWNS